MNTNRQAAPRVGSARKIALAAGVIYLLTFVSIPSIALYAQVKSANYITGAGPDTAAIIGGILEIIVALAGIGTAIVLFPVLKKQNETLALGLVAARVLEASTIFLGVAFLFSIVTLRQEGAGADALVSSHTLATLYDRIFLLGQSFMPGVDDLLLGYLLYKSRLVPRVLPVMAFIAAPLLLASAAARVWDIGGTPSKLWLIAGIPIAIWEFSLGVYLTVKGFKPSPITAGMAAAGTRGAYQDPAA